MRFAPAGIWNVRMLLISDANILIDMEVGGLLEAVFGLPESFAVPDILFEEELAPYYPQLRGAGLKVYSLTSESIEYVVALRVQHGKLGDNDLFAWALARQEGCPLLTGDQGLRVAAQADGIVVKGTLWLMDRLVTENVITPGQAAEAYRRMRAHRSRLPWREVEQQLREWGV